MNIKGQGHSLNFVQGHSDSTFSIFFCSETARPIEAKFHTEPPWDGRNENLFKCSRSNDHAYINYGEKLIKSFSSEPRGRWLWNLVFSIGYSSTTNTSYDDIGLTLTIFMTAYMWILPDHPGASRKCVPTSALPRVRQNLPDVKIQNFFFFSRSSFLHICMVIMATCCWKAINS